MNVQVWRFLLLRRVVECRVVVEAMLFGFLARGFVRAVFGRRAKAISDLSQVHRTTRLPWMRRLVEPYISANLSATHSPPVPLRDRNIARLFGSWLIVLKEPKPDGERGVLLVMFSEMLSLLCAKMDMPRLLHDYTLVFEPSWCGYCDEDLLRFTQFGDDIFVSAAQKDDLAFLQRLHSNLIPVDMGPCDWVDPRVAEPFIANAKEFDIVMNSHWGGLKRHHVLFRILKRARRRYKVVLIGGPWGGRTRSDVEALAQYYGVRDQLTVFENIPYHAVMDKTCRSRVSILLSLKEGSNRAISESIFCNVPVVVLANHVGGIVKNVVLETGLLVPERKLEPAVERLIQASLNPRAWAIERISCFKSSEKLNAVLREHALDHGLPWTQDIAVRACSPDSKYVYESDLQRLAPWNRSLGHYLK
jgi:glycosyltransferase involved in cell wall biosynthesis